MTTTDPGVVDYEPALPSDHPWRTVTRWLIVLCVAVYLVDLLLTQTGHYRVLSTHTGQHIVQRTPEGRPTLIGEPVLTHYGEFSVDLAIAGGQVWRFVTYQFCHANFDHIFLNMLGLLLVGPLVEARMGRWQFLVFYLVCGTAGPAAHIGLSLLGVLQMSTVTPLVGASASIYGVLVAAARIAPDEVVMLAFPPIDLKLRTFALLLIGLSLAAVTWRWNNAGGHAAHLGGAVAGWWLSRQFTKRPRTGPYRS